MNDSSDYGEEIVRGQSVDEVNSEITEILKLERFVGTSEEMCENKVTLIGKYSRALYNLWSGFPDESEHKDHANEVIEKVDELLERYREIPDEDVLSDPEKLDGRFVHVMSISNDPKTEKIVPEELYPQVYESMERHISIRKLAKLSKIANELALLLSSEFDLHKDLTRDFESQEDFEGDYFDE